MSNQKRLLTGLLALALLALLVAPYRAAAQAATKMYDVTIMNINSGKQGLSPLMIATHPASVHAWQLGQLASPGTALLAREGMPDMLAAELRGKATDVMTTGAHLLPGDGITVRITAKDGDTLSAATMLIQTNDGFTGLDSVPLTDGTTETVAYDAGAEDNTELAVDVPGPPFGGKFHGPNTTPPQPISMHPGIRGDANVTPDFKWTGAVARFTIKAVDSSSPPAPGSVSPGSSIPAQAGVKTYDVTIMNINSGKQGLSPLVIATHPASVHAWQLGQLASPGTALLAREGMPDMLAAELQGGATAVMTTGAHLLPGDGITVRITAKDGDMLSAVTMLIQTNDGFTGLDSVPLTGGATEMVAYDAGAEDNTELAVDVPGPPFGGKFHGPNTTPPQPISMHPGIKGTADVTPDFKWSGPVARFTIQDVSAAAAGAPGATNPVPGMPTTGEADTTMWLVAAIAAILSLLLVFAGFTMRRAATRRQ